MAFHGMCVPEWAQNSTDCPYGSVFMRLTTWPNETAEVNWFSAIVNVMYGVSPVFAVLFFLYRFVVVWLFSESHKQKDEQLDATLGAYQHDLKYTLLSFLVLILNTVQKTIFRHPRPAISCLTTCGFPDGLAMWSVAMMTAIFIDLMFQWSVPHLTSAARGMKPFYEKKDMEMLGYYPIHTQKFLIDLVAMIVFFAPISTSRIVVGDATYVEVAFGDVEGFLLALVFHVLYVKIMVDPVVGRKIHFWIKTSMVCGGHFYEHLVDQLPPAPENEEIGDKVKRIVGHLQVSAHAASVNSRPPQQQTMRPGGDAELAQPLLEKKTRDRRWPPASVVDIPGLEFAGITTETLIQEFAADVQDIEAEKAKAEDEAKKSLAALKADAEAKAEELLQQAQQDREKMIQDSKNELRELEIALESKAAVAKAKAEKEADDQRARLKEEMDATRAEMKKRLEEDLNREKKANQDLIDALKKNAEALNKLQDAKAIGDIHKLGDALQEKNVRELLEGTMGAGGDSLDSALFVPVAKLAQETYLEWRRARDLFRQALNVAEKESGNIEAGQPSTLKDKDASNLFASLVACTDKGLVLKLDPVDKSNCEHAESYLIAWAKVTYKHYDFEIANNVHNSIISKAVWAQTKDELGNFDATDFVTCLQTVDRKDKKFKDLALKQVEKVNVPDAHGKMKKVSDLTGALQQLSTLIFFLDYINKEDLDKTYWKFKENLKEKAMSKRASAWIDGAEGSYHGTDTLLQKEDLEGISDKEPISIIESMESRNLPGMDVFKGIFCMLARVWEQDFGVLAVPHHTQVVALLVFKAFLEDDSAKIKTLIGQVSTGEGKSMLIAALALFIVSQTDASKRRRVHVIGSDEKLVLRDFESFKGVFNAWQAKELKMPPAQAANFAVACGSARIAKTSEHVRTMIPDDAWIVYCEAKHVTSYYTQKARTGKLDPAIYQNLVLIIDEVDALIVDKDPTDNFVYDISSRTLHHHGQELKIGDYAMKVGLALRNNSTSELASVSPQDASAESIFREVAKLMKQVKAWEESTNPEVKAQYSNDSGTYMRMDKGMPNPDYKSNFLEVLRLKSQKNYEMAWYERLFVMSGPRVFKLYRKIVGFSGTIGNEKEQGFLSDAYGAQFFLVPPFLQTCKELDSRGDEVNLFFVAEWVKPERYKHANVSGGPAWVLPNQEQQLEYVKKVAWAARDQVPVLIIAKDPEQVQIVVDGIRDFASKIIGQASDDVIRSLSQTDYQKSPKDYKENLRLSTRCSAQKSTTKLWRITVTDPSGARGTDYRMDDDDADLLGGLFLIVMNVPFSERDWIQYKGRTARQKWKGQYCVALNAQEYSGEAALPTDVVSNLSSVEGCDRLINSILSYGQRRSEEMLAKCHVVYNAGFVANEICEKVWLNNPPKITKGTVDIGMPEGEARSAFMKCVTMYRYLNFKDLAKEAAICDPDLANLGGSGPGSSEVPDRNYVPEVLEAPPKLVLFLFDVSYSMNGPVGSTTRVAACKEQLGKMMTNKAIVGEHDLVGVVVFGFGYKYLIQIGRNQGERVKEMVEHGELEASMTQEPVPAVHDRRFQERDGQSYTLGKMTWFFSSLVALVNDLKNSDYDAYPKYLIALTDGEPHTSQPGDGHPNPGNKQEAQAALKGYSDQGNNLIIITVSSDIKDDQQFKDLVSTVQCGGGVAKYVSAKNIEDASAIARAFADVEQALVDTSGQTETE